MISEKTKKKINKLVEMANAKTPINYGTRKFTRIASIHWIDAGERIMVFLTSDDTGNMTGVYLENLDLED